jgi:ribosomal protein S9
VSTTYVYGTGRRKEAVARVRLLPGDGLGKNRAG